MNFIKNLLLYISAFVPMYFLILIKLIVEICNDNLHFNVLNTLNLITLLSLIFFGIIGLIWNIHFEKEKSKEIIILEKKNITDQHFLGYFSLFVFFAIPLDLANMSNYCIYVAILILIGIVYINNSLYYINPLLNILGYNFYNITYREKDGQDTRTAKIFYRGTLILENKTYWVKLKNTNFAFIDKRPAIDNKKDKV